MNTWSGDVAQFRDLEVVFYRVVRVATYVAGIAVFLMLIAGGFQYITAGDDPKAAEKASKTLTYAVIGLVVVLAAWFILRAIESITGFSVTIFDMPEPAP